MFLFRITLLSVFLSLALQVVQANIVDVNSSVVSQANKQSRLVAEEISHFNHQAAPLLDFLFCDKHVSDVELKAVIKKVISNEAVARIKNICSLSNQLVGIVSQLKESSVYGASKCFSTCQGYLELSKGNLAFTSKINPLSYFSDNAASDCLRELKSLKSRYNGDKKSLFCHLQIWYLGKISNCFDSMSSWKITGANMVPSISISKIKDKLAQAQSISPNADLVTELTQVKELFRLCTSSSYPDFTKALDNICRVENHNHQPKHHQHQPSTAPTSSCAA